MIQLSEFTLMSSNPDKLSEYIRFGVSGLKCAAGPDLDEVAGSPDDVILYKSVASGINTIVEDSIILVDGIPMVDIRWKLDSLSALFGKTMAFEVRLGVNDGKSIHVFLGRVSGHLVAPRGLGGFGFDPYLEIDGTGLTLSELDTRGLKDDHNPRYDVIRQLISWHPVYSIDIDSIPSWSGQMQVGN